MSSSQGATPVVECGVTILEKEVLQLFLQVQELCIGNLDNFHQGPVESFELSIALWPVGNSFNVPDSQEFTESREFCGDELSTIIREYCFWYPMGHKDAFQAFDDTLSADIPHYFRPSSVVVHNHKQLVSLWQWTTQIDCNVSPRAAWKI